VVRLAALIAASTNTRIQEENSQSVTGMFGKFLSTEDENCIMNEKFQHYFKSDNYTT
jgi:hypothetical protein